VRKVADEQQPEGGRVRLSSHTIYETIKRSNSSLNRKPKKLLEDSIERVLEVFQSDILGDGESDSIEGDFDGLEEDKEAAVVRLLLIRGGEDAQMLMLIAEGIQWFEQKYRGSMVYLFQAFTCTSEGQRLLYSRCNWIHSGSDQETPSCRRVCC
jgi:hypothetical protein